MGPRGAHGSICHAHGVGRRVLRGSELLRAVRFESRVRPALQRARACISDDATFRDARFELDEAGVVKHFDEHSWAWNDNPFVGTRELNGLKIVIMLLSNWDNKDVRDVARGSNTAIFEHHIARGRAGGTLSDYRLGRRAGRVGQQRVEAWAVGSGGLCGAEQPVRPRHRQRLRTVGLQGTAHHGCGRRYHAARRGMDLQVSGRDQRRTTRRRPEGQRRHRNGDCRLHASAARETRPVRRNRPH